VLTIVDNSSPQAIKAAIQKVIQTNQSTRPGRDALADLLAVPETTHSHDALESKYGIGVPNLHFSWFRRRVAEEAEDAKPLTYALVDPSTGVDGQDVAYPQASGGCCVGALNDVLLMKLSSTHTPARIIGSASGLFATYDAHCEGCCVIRGRAGKMLA